MSRSNRPELMSRVSSFSQRNRQERSANCDCPNEPLNLSRSSCLLTKVNWPCAIVIGHGTPWWSADNFISLTSTLALMSCRLSPRVSFPWPRALQVGDLFQFGGEGRGMDQALQDRLGLGQVGVQHQLQLEQVVLLGQTYLQRTVPAGRFIETSRQPGALQYALADDHIAG